MATDVRAAHGIGDTAFERKSALQQLLEQMLAQVKIANDVDMIDAEIQPDTNNVPGAYGILFSVPNGSRKFSLEFKLSGFEPVQPPEYPIPARWLLPLLGASKEALGVAHAVWNAAGQVLGSQPATGGCTPFYTAEQWAERQESYGLNSELIICHDGGDLAPLINLDYERYQMYDEFDRHLRKLGYYVEPCTCWYAAVYRTP